MTNFVLIESDSGEKRYLPPEDLHNEMKTINCKNISEQKSENSTPQFEQSLF